MKTCIVTSFDENYFKYSMVMLRSLSQNYSYQVPLDVICLVPVKLLTEENSYIEKLDAPNLNIQFRASTKYEDLVRDGVYRYKPSSYISANALQRIFLSSTLHDYAKAIYIDPDAIILRDIKPLLDYPLHGKIVALQETDYMNLKTFNTVDVPYFNNGVFITDLNYWRENNIEEKMVSWLKANEIPDCVEQDLMNIFLFPVWSPMPHSFNFFDQNGDKVIGDGPLIVHFIGEGKPWVEGPLETAWRTKWQEIFNQL